MATVRIATTLAVLALISLPAHADRQWEFDIAMPGIYGVQVEHLHANLSTGSKAVYSVSMGSETRSRELVAIAGSRFVPIVVEIARPQTMRVAISGLDDLTLKRTRVHPFNMDYLPYGEHFDPVKNPRLENIDGIKRLLSLRPEHIDLARFKLAIDKMVSPDVNVDKALRDVEEMAQRVRALPTFGTSANSKAMALQQLIYTAGPWNEHRPFEYDLDDPLGSNPKNKLLSTYLSSRKGNCVTMPLLFAILGQRIGLDVTLTTTPNHILVKFRNSLGAWINLETTSGANPAREVWIRQQTPTITDKAMENGIYLQVLTRKEAASVAASLLAEHYLRIEQYQKAIAAADLLIEHYPKYVGMIILKGVAYGRLSRQYESSPRKPPLPAWYREHLARNNHAWFAKAEALGWREETKDEKQKYLELIQGTKQGNINKGGLQ